MDLHLHTQVYSFPDSIRDPITNIISLGMERRAAGTEYYYDNRMRSINAILFQYTIRGTGCLEIGGTTHTVSPGQAFFVQIPGDTRYYLPKRASEDWVFLYLLIETGHMEHYYQETVRASGILFDMDENCSVISFLKDAITRSRTGLISDFSTASIIAFEFMNRIYFHFNDTSSGYSSRIQRALRYMQQNYGHLEGVSPVAEALGISENHLIRQFRQEVGITPMKYLTEIRLAHAKKQLLTTNHPIQEIARECGYIRANYFCRVFKQNTGLTPHACRTGLHKKD